MNEFAKKQQEWAKIKYVILAKSQNDYKRIRGLFSKTTNWDQEKEKLYEHYMNHALESVSKKGEFLNAYQHVWGYFKKKATKAERVNYQQLCEGFSLEKDELLLFLRELALKYQEPYLLESFLLFPEKMIRQNSCNK